MKSYNVLRIIFILLTKGKTTVNALAEELEVSTRTVKRYIGVIEGLDLPIVVISGRNGGVSFDNAEFSRRFDMSEKDIEAVIDAFSPNNTLVNLLRGEYLDFSDILHRIKANDFIDIDFSKWLYNTKNDVTFAAIKRSIALSRQIEFDYYDMYNQRTHRVIDPYKIAFKENAWYVYGICHLRNAPRFFKIRKMRNVRILDATYTKGDIDEFDFKNFFDNCKKIVLTMEVSKEMAAKVYEDFDDDEITEKDTCLDVRSVRPDNSSLLPLVMSYGKYAKVKAPQEIIEALVDHTNEMEKLYKGDKSCPVRVI